MTGGAAGAVKPVVAPLSPLARRDGAKRSGLTGPRTAGQSVVVMAATLFATTLLSTSRDETSETRGCERQVGGDGAVAV
jgi:hypothetical protein